MSVTICMDFETADNGADSACAIGMARIEDNRINDVFYSLIRPPRTRMLYTWVHGLTWNDVKDAPDFAALWPEVCTFMTGADHFAAHNAAFDRGVLRACCAASGLSTPAPPFLCTLKGARKALQLPSHKLNVVCEYFDIKLDHHHAGSDATAAANILLRLRALGLDDTLMLLGESRSKR